MTGRLVRCSTCGRELPEFAFTRHARRQPRIRCKPCVVAANLPMQTPNTRINLDALEARIAGAR